MAESAIQIIIDVLASEGITSVDDFSKALGDAFTATDTLSGSVDDLDLALSGISKSGLSARDMAAAVATALEDAGIKVEDTSGLVTVLAKAFTQLGAAGKEAASGVDLATKADEEFVGPSNAATDSIIRQGAAYKGAAIDAAAYESALKGMQVGMASNAIMQDAAVANLGAGYARMTSLAEMATPALMKAATWAGIGLAGLAYEGIKQYTNFNKLITQTITQAGEAPSKMGFLTNLAESVAKSTGQGLTDVANTIYRAASGTASWNAGLGATKKQLTDIVTQVSKLNIIGAVPSGPESEQSSRVVTALINANMRGVGHNPTQAAALVNAIVGSGDMRLADLVPGIGRGILQSAVANDMTAKDAFAWVATLTSTGTKASMAANYVKTGINLLAHPSAQGTNALAMLGIKPGEMQNLIDGPGGLVAAASTLKEGMKRLNPANSSIYFFNPDKPGQSRPGGSGRAGALARLQTWSANLLPASFTNAWMAGKLTAKQQIFANSLVMTKAFGGSKQFATIAGLIDQIPMLKGIEAHITKQDNPAYFNAQYRRTEALPATQFARMKQSLLVDLVNIGKELTPLGLTFGHVMTDVIGGLTKFKGVIWGFAAIAMSLLAAAGIGKMATLATHMAPLIGAGYNRLGSMVGENSAFGSKMLSRANSGAFSYLNIYKSKKGAVLSKLGGESMSMAGGMAVTDAQLGAGGTVAGLSTGENVINSTQARGNVFLEKIAINTQVTADEMAKSGLGGVSSGVARASGAGGAIESAAQRDANMAASTPSGSFYMGNGVQKDLSSMMPGAIFLDQKTGRYTKMLANGRRTFVSNSEAYASGAMNGPKALGAGSIEAGTQLSSASSSDVIALASKSDSTLAGVASYAGQDAAKIAETGGSTLFSGLGETLGGIAGGPVGMMGMMMAPMLIGALLPAFGKVGSWLGSLFGGGSHTSIYHPHINNPLDTATAAARLAKATTTLRAFQTKVKNKAGKEVWGINQSVQLANMNAYIAAHHAYIKAGGDNALALKDANAVNMTAYDYLYGSKRGTLSELEKAARKNSKGMVSFYAMGMAGSPGAPGSHVTQSNALKKYVDSLPGGPGGYLQKAVWKRIHHNGPGQFAEDYRNIGKILHGQQAYYQKVFSDASSESAQALAKTTPAFAAMESGGLFGIASQIGQTRQNMENFLNYKVKNKHGKWVDQTTASQAAKYLPLYAHKYHQLMQADQTALAATGHAALTGAARLAFQAQEKEAKAALDKTDTLIQEMRKTSKDTHLAGDSVDKLAKENASALVASGLPNDIAVALAKVLSPYLKTSSVVKTGGTVTRPKYSLTG